MNISRPPLVFNGAICDAQTFLRDRVVVPDGVCAVPVFAFWDAQAVRGRR